MEGLSLTNVYLTLFFAGLGITGLMLLLGLVHDLSGLFGDHDISGHDGGDVSHHFDFLHWLSTLSSPLMLSVFLTVFGGIGYLCTQIPVLNLPVVNLRHSTIGAPKRTATPQSLKECRPNCRLKLAQ